ncbi:MAG: hypothetical protein HYV97_05020 [Bdellovibrio sp.]|nr:hypothetical protein [Bdellovibrio sp.]
MKILIVLTLSLAVSAQEEPQTRAISDQPSEEMQGSKLIVTCPEVIRPKIELKLNWSSQPCAAKFKGLSPNEKGGQKDFVQCYYNYICGGGEFTIEKKFPKYSCRPYKEHSVECYR